MQIYENLMIWTNFLWVVCQKSVISAESTIVRVLVKADYSPRERLFEQYRDCLLCFNFEPWTIPVFFLRRAHLFLVFIFCRCLISISVTGFFLSWAERRSRLGCGSRWRSWFHQWNAKNCSYWPMSSSFRVSNTFSLASSVWQLWASLWTWPCFCGDFVLGWKGSNDPLSGQGNIASLLGI